MPFVLQSSGDGKTARVPFESYARIGSSPQCDVVIEGADLPPHAATIVEDGGACRLVVKSAGLRVNDRACDEGTSLVLRAGDSVQLNSVALSLLPDLRPAAPAGRVVTEVVRHALPEAVRGGFNAADGGGVPTPAGPTHDRPSGSGVALQLAGILFCVAVVGGMVAWMFLGTRGPSPGAKSAVQGPMTLPQIIDFVNEQHAWPWRSISKEEVLADLRLVYKLENMDRRPEARERLKEIRAALLTEATLDDRGHFVSPQRPDADAAAKPAKREPAPSLTQRWFPEPDRRRLYDALSSKYAEL